MITRLTGILAERDFTEAAIDVNGVTYSVSIPLSTYDKLPPLGEKVTLYTHLSVREDDMQLFGFSTKEERSLFRMLVSAVSGVGPKLALGVLSGISMDAFQAAVANSDIKALSKINGIGKRTAERIVLEMKDKMGNLSLPGNAPVMPTKYSPEAADAIAALVSLQIKHDTAEKTIAKISAENPGASTSDLIRKALAAINS